MADWVAFGQIRSQLIVLGTFPGDDGTLAAAMVTDSLAAHKCEAAWTLEVQDFALENNAGTGIDEEADPTGVEGDPPALNPETPPTG